MSRREPPAQGLADLLNLGPTSARMLARAGIRSPAELALLGAVDAYLTVRRAGERPSLNLLYALEGALTGVHWNKLPPGERERLLLELDQRRR